MQPETDVIHAVTGEDHRDAIRHRVIDPLGMEKLAVGVPPADEGDIVDVVLTGEPATPDELEADIGIRHIDVGEVTDEALLSLSRPAAREVGLPGGGGISNAADITRFYRAVLHDPKGLWEPAIREDVTTVARSSLPDPIFGVPANRTRGLLLAGDDGRTHMRGMGRTVSPGTFGHNGAAGQIAWADPATGLALAYLTNGRDQHFLREHRRTTALASLAAVCAG